MNLFLIYLIVSESNLSVFYPKFPIQKKNEKLIESGLIGFKIEKKIF